MTWEWFWHLLRAQWPQAVFIIARGVTLGLVIYGTMVITRWQVRRNIVAMLPEISRDKLQRAYRDIDYLRQRLEESEEREHQLRAIIRGTIATASHTLNNLMSVAPVTGEIERR